MSFRLSALVAVVGVLALGSIAPAFGQPIPPQRPRATPFGAIFSPPLQQQQLQQQQIINQAMGGRGVGPGFIGPGLGNPLFFGAPGLGAGPLAYQSALLGAFAPVAPPTTSTGVVGSFGNYGHWYPNPSGGQGSGNYGHWYPNGVASGSGVLGASGGSGLSGGLYGSATVNPGGAGAGGAGAGAGGMRRAAGAAAGAGAAANQFRR